MSSPISTKIRCESIKKWLNSRGRTQASIKYRVTPSEYNKHIMLEKIFNKFDCDNNHSLDQQEVKSLFRENNINISNSSIKQMFAIVGRNSGSITLDEFKKFSLSHVAQSQFKNIIEKVNHSTERSNKYLPYNFNRLMNKFYITRSRRAISQDIDNIKRSLSIQNSVLASVKYNELLNLDEIHGRALERNTYYENYVQKSKIALKESSYSDAVDHVSIERKASQECNSIIKQARREALAQTNELKYAANSHVRCHQPQYKTQNKVSFTQRYMSSSMKDGCVCPRLASEIMKKSRKSHRITDYNIDLRKSIYDNVE